MIIRKATQSFQYGRLIIDSRHLLTDPLLRCQPSRMKTQPTWSTTIEGAKRKLARISNANGEERYTTACHLLSKSCELIGTPLPAPTEIGKSYLPADGRKI